ncbi:Asparagine synthetase family protein [Granulibacter bethesdensis]|uniref:asparagine synthase (glutamine-hydrolyzing) n=1 Tax=Granulibacter bethesdensis TaxID=364410 RepID=UPI00090AFCBF|nr:asparagine synthase (glutamine-hydrolyzing) [Granulibacter bethesdensis]APH57808.1 Asparagine synthetase family protein [Granulibacter bethesdensis]
MCGIAGVIMASGQAAPDPSLLGDLATALHHRGPDGSGHTQIGRVAMVHTRLAIVDPEGGDQPIFAGSSALVANGEIYNDLALREAMPDVSFSTGSDCEPPLHLWLREGPDYTVRLRGMYAIAIHERAARTVTLSRDPFGIKPLYVARLAGGVAFASQPSALLDAGLVKRDVAEAQRNELLQLQFTTGADTIFPGIQRVLPGETLICRDGQILDRRRISALPEGPAEEIGEEEALARLDAALEESVALHQRADVPYGMFLSGGIDSATVLSLMARLNDSPVLAFTAGFDVPGAADEREYAAALAAAAGARHRTVTVTESMVWRHLPEIVACMDDPAADYAIIPTWFLARRAREDVKVVLSGEGGDELFGGYGRYRSAMRPWWRGGRVMRSKGHFDGLDVLHAIPPGWRDGIAAAESRVSPLRSRLAAAQETDTTDWLPHDLLLKLDRCLMAHGVEGRTPLLDPGVAEAAFRLPDRLKVQDGKGKYILRRWLERHSPQARPFAAKQGFTVPVAAWIAARGHELGPLVARQRCIQAIARPDRVVSLFRHAHGRREGFAAWILLFYALWHRAHIEAKPMDGDVFSVLAD